MGKVAVSREGASVFFAWKLLKRLAPQVGLEPTTLRLTAECSTIELLRIRAGRLLLIHYNILLQGCQISVLHFGPNVVPDPYAHPHSNPHEHHAPLYPVDGQIPDRLCLPLRRLDARLARFCLQRYWRHDGALGLI